jgi:5'-phosphate synthase pdxT subunit
MILSRRWPGGKEFCGEETGLSVIGVLALQGDVREHVAAIEDAGARAVAVRRLPEIEAVDGLVVPGGESTTLWRLTMAFELLEPLQKLVGEGMPAFGSCAGMIMLADRITDGVAGQQTFGGIDMTVRRNAFGRQVDSFERAVAFDAGAAAETDGTDGTGDGDDGTGDGAAEPLRAVFIRAPWVESVGADVSVLASDGGRIVAVRQGALLATAFHPELTPDRRVHRLFISMVKGTR